MDDKNNQRIIRKMIEEFNITNPLYTSMLRYYEGEHDIVHNYHLIRNASNTIVVKNFVNKFINEEVQYALGNPISYVSLSGNKDIVNAIYRNTFHWKETHNQELFKTLEIFGTAYILNYIDSKGRFSERILNPLQGILYSDDDGTPIRFIHFYKKKYDTAQYKDVYYPDGRIEIYKGNVLIDTKTQIFREIPVSVCKLDSVEDTIYYKIKSIQDDYNKVLSDTSNNISDFRSAYLVVAGIDLDEEGVKALKEDGILNFPDDTNIKLDWLMKQLPDGYINNHLDRLEESMYSLTNHINGNEKLQSNTSGNALRNRLIFLEQRCNSMLQVMVDVVYERIGRLFEYLAIKGTQYDLFDIKIETSPCIPQDEISIVQMLVQLGIGENISLETALAQLPFIENPLQEMEKISKEQSERKSIELDKLDDIEF